MTRASIARPRAALREDETPQCDGLSREVHVMRAPIARPRAALREEDTLATGARFSTLRAPPREDVVTTRATHTTARAADVRATLADLRARWAGWMVRMLLASAAASAALGCGPIPRQVPPVPPSLAEWRAALADLDALRAKAAGDGPHTLKLSLALREPFTGRRTEARGAVAISSADRAVRMILVGPGGTTAFDLWIKGDAFRVSIPAVDLLRRGDASTPKEQMRGLPVDFLRWWLLDPTRGELLWTERAGDTTRYTLREGGAITTLEIHGDRRGAARDAASQSGGAQSSQSGGAQSSQSAAGGAGSQEDRAQLSPGAAHGATSQEDRAQPSPGAASSGDRVQPWITAQRRTWSRALGAGADPSSGAVDGSGAAPAVPVLLDEESVEADGVGCGHARYTQASTGVEIEITCEGVEPNPPSARAFVDPDAPEEDE